MKIRVFVATLAPPAASSLVVLALWHWSVTIFEIQPFLLPGPLVVAEAIDHNMPALIHATGLTATGAAAGFGLSFCAGLVIAILFSQSRLIERSLYPYAIFLQTVPIVAIAPLIVLWIGHGLSGVIAVSFILSLFPIVVNATSGLTTIHPDLVDLFSLNRASRWQILIKLRLPNAVPSMLTGARISCGLSVIGAIVGEFFAGYGAEDYGLGYLIILTNAQTKTAYLFAAILCSTFLGLAFFVATSSVSRAVMRRWDWNT